MPFFRIKTPTRDERGSLPFALLTIVLTASLSVTTMSALSFQSTKQNVAMNQIKENSSLKTAVARATEQISQFKTYAEASKEAQQRGETLTPLQWCEQLASGQEWSLASGRPVTQSQVNGDSQNVETRVSGTSKQAQINSQKFTRWRISCESKENSPANIESGFLTVYVETGKKNDTEFLRPSGTKGIGQSLYPTDLWDKAPLGQITARGTNASSNPDYVTDSLSHPVSLNRTDPSTPEESIEKRFGPHGEEVTVLETNSLPINQTGKERYSRAGGWYGPSVQLERESKYRISVWVKRTANSSPGPLYIGGIGDVRSLNTCTGGCGERGSNFYWGLRTNDSGEPIPTDEWVLAVMHIHPSSNPVRYDPNSGIWRKDGTLIPLSSDAFGWNSFAGSLRSDYTFYQSGLPAKFSLAVFVNSSAGNISYQFYNPRIDELDGSEPEISKLLNPPPPENEVVAINAQKIVFKDGKVFHLGPGKKAEAKIEEPDAVE